MIARVMTPPHAADVARWIGLVLGMAAVCTRAVAPLTELPGWDMDPFLIATPVAELGPALSLWLDVIILAGAGLVLLGETLAGRRIHLKALLLVAAGLVPVIWHGWLAHPLGPHVSHQRLGVAWASGFLFAAAAFHACRDERYRRVVAAVLLGMIVVLALKGVQQVVIQHPRTVAMFEENRELVLASQGWTADSSMARSYERRLRQPEATGWFGLANVYASFAAMGLVTFLPLAMVAVRGWLRRESAEVPRPPAMAVALMLLGLAAAGAALLASGAKGGIIAAAAGVAALAALLLLVRRALSHPADRRPRHFVTALALFAVAGPILLIILQGQLGERIRDLSLLFRWFYLEASARIFAMHPVVGVGPDGVQAVYPLVKNPLSPEDIRSPHNILLDWITTLGVFGLAWAAVWLAWLVRAAHRPVDLAVRNVAHGPVPSGDALRPEWRAAALVAAIATIIGTLVESATATPEAALVRVLGLVLWAAVGWAVITVAVNSLTLAISLAAGGLAFAAHAQIDVTGSWAASAPVLLLFFGAAAAPHIEPVSTVARRRTPLRFAPAALILCMAIAAAALAAWPALQWQTSLTGGSRAANRIARAHSLLEAARTAPTAAEARAAQADALAHLSLHLQRRVEPTAQAVERGMLDLEIQSATAAAKRLERAAAVYPSDWRTRREAGRATLRLAAALQHAGRATEAAAAADRAVTLAGGPPPAVGQADYRRAPELSWLALVYRTRHELGLGAPSGQLDLAATALEAAMRRDPYSTDNSARLFDVYQELGQHEQAVHWARRTLELDALNRLDPEGRALSPARREQIRAVAERGEP